MAGCVGFEEGGGLDEEVENERARRTHTRPIGTAPTEVA
jgi:hypothetical protein